MTHDKGRRGEREPHESNAVMGVTDPAVKNDFDDRAAFAPAGKDPTNKQTNKQTQSGTADVRGRLGGRQAIQAGSTSVMAAGRTAACLFVKELGGYIWPWEEEPNEKHDSSSSSHLQQSAAVPSQAVSSIEGKGVSQVGGQDGEVSKRKSITVKFPNWSSGGSNLHGGEPWRTTLSADQLAAYAQRFEALADMAEHRLGESAQLEPYWRSVVLGMYPLTNKQTTPLKAVPVNDPSAIELVVSVLVLLACGPHVHQSRGHDGYSHSNENTNANAGVNATATRDYLRRQLVHWSIIGKNSKEGFGGGSNDSNRTSNTLSTKKMGSLPDYDGTFTAAGLGWQAMEFHACYHAAASSGLLPPHAQTPDYERRYNVVAELASALLWQRHWASVS
jgi:hypothetical protein